jgi:vanillate O-demethylase ferredoxin subunit
MAASNPEFWQKGLILKQEQIAFGINQIVIRQESAIKADPGTHIDVFVETSEGRVRRSYSIVKQSKDLFELTLGIFQVPNSRGGSIAMQKLSAGDVIDITQPLQSFPLRVGAPKYVLIAGGIGITALFSMASLVKAIGAKYEIHYSARSRESMAFREELEEIHAGNIHFYQDDVGERMNIGSLISNVDPEAEAYICGPIRMMDEIRRTWSSSGLEPTNLRYETFGASGWFDPEEFVVRIPSQGVEVLVGKDSSMLQALEAAGVEMLSDCRKGECGLCEVRVSALNGKIDHRDVFYSERQKDSASKLSCCVSRVISENSETPAVIEIIPT